MDTNEVKSQIEASGHRRVKVAITDVDGILRGKFIHKDKFYSALDNGFGFCNVVLGWDSSDVCYDNTKFAGWHTGYPDAHVSLDPKTLRFIPWEKGVPFLLGDFSDGRGGDIGVCPRGVLKRQIKLLKEMGFEAKVGVEFEWFNFLEDAHSLHEKNFKDMTPITPGMFGYSVLRAAQKSDFFGALMDQLLEANIPLEGLHTETGPGVYEAAIMASEPLEAADRAVLMKSGTKEIAHGFGIVPTFMARWNVDLPGSSGHLHQSLSKGGKNVFFDSGDPNRMSQTFKHYLAGVIKLLPEFAVMFAPNVNSYKRLVEGFWAPTRSLWGVDNRTVACRVIPGSEKSTRLEVRAGGADINPYLAIAASLAAGAYGIQNKLGQDVDPVKGNGYESREGVKLPANLKAAAERFESSEVAVQMFGKEFVEHFAASRDFEWREYQKAVTDWELKRYFEII